MKPVEEHLAACLAAVSPLAPVELAPLDALDCLLAEDVAAAVDLPAFDNSSMDGYAVRVADVSSAPVRLRVVADLPAGTALRPRLVPGTAIRIMTGAPVPEGTEAIVPVERTDAGLDEVTIYEPAGAGEFIRRAAEDVRTGEVVLRAGVRLTPRHVGLLAAIGRAAVRAVPRPRVTVISTGSELVEPGSEVAFGQIYDSNGPALAAAAAELGCAVRRVAGVADDAALLEVTLAEEAARADVLITSGGVSAGAYDTVKEVLSRLGTVRFDRVAMQPGMPQGLGVLGETPIFTLPGNPVSSMVSFEVFVRPALRLLLGEPELHRRTVMAAAGVGWSSPAGKRQFVRARLDGETVVPVGGHGSHLVADLAEASCLAVVPADVTAVSAGDRLICMLLERSRQ